MRRLVSDLRESWDEELPGQWASGLAMGVLVAVACTSLGLFFGRWLPQADLVMLHLLGVLIVATRYPLGPALAAAALNALAFDFVFIPPRFGFSWPDLRSTIVFSVMGLTAICVAGVNQRLRAEKRMASLRERITASLYRLSRDLGSARSTEQVVAVAVRDLSEVCGAAMFVLLADGDELSLARATPELPAASTAAARDCWHTLAPNEKPLAPGKLQLWVPLLTPHRPVGVLGAIWSSPRRESDVPMRSTLERCAQIVAIAIERNELLESARKAELRAEVEQLRNSLLGAVSHDIRTPLASIGAAAAVLADPRHTLGEEPRRELAATIVEETQRLTRRAQNLLELARLRTGQVVLKSDPVALDELVEVALRRLAPMLDGRHIDVTIPDDAPLVSVDRMLLEQVLVNLLENASKYSPPGAPIEIRASYDGASVTLAVLDRGPGLDDAERRQVFGRFEGSFRARSSDGGLGLGLAIARAIVESHGGLMTLEGRPDGGTLAGIRLPKAQGMPLS